MELMRAGLSQSCDHLVMVEQREDLATDEVLRIPAIIEDETVPYPLVPAIAIPVTLAASANLVAVDLAPPHALRLPHGRLAEVAVSAACLVGALATGLGLPFLFAAIAR